MCFICLVTIIVIYYRPTSDCVHDANKYNNYSRQLTIVTSYLQDICEYLQDIAVWSDEPVTSLGTCKSQI